MIPDVFGPARLGPVVLRNRVVKAATFEGRTPDGQVTDGLIDYHLAVARGGVGLTTVAYLAIAPEGRTHAEQIVVGEHSLAGLSRMAEAIHETGAKIAGQVGHAGPVANGRSNRVTAISASRMPSPLSMQMVHAATEADLTRVTAAYVDAARTLVRAGFDVLELHMAHSYLLSSFLAPGLNRRHDRWGGRLENRARLARQVARAVRDEVGGEVAITAKVSLDDGFRGGLRGEEALDFARMLETDRTLDALQLSGGSSLMNPMYLFRGDAPRREFAAVMPQPVRLGMQAPREAVPQGVPVPGGLLPRARPPVPAGAGHAVDAARRHQPAGDDGAGDGRGLRVRRPRPERCSGSRTSSTGSGRDGRWQEPASTATSACRRSTTGPGARSPRPPEPKAVPQPFLPL